MLQTGSGKCTLSSRLTRGCWDFRHWSSVEMETT